MYLGGLFIRGRSTNGVTAAQIRSDRDRSPGMIGHLVRPRRRIEAAHTGREIEVTTHAHPSPATVAPLRRQAPHRRASESSHGKWLFVALLVLLLSAVVIGFSL